MKARASLAARLQVPGDRTRGSDAACFRGCTPPRAPLWRCRSTTLSRGWTRELCALPQSVLGILCVSWGGLFPSFLPPNSVFPFWLGGGLAPDMVHSGSFMAFVLLGPPSTCGVNCHYNDGIMSFGVMFQSIFTPSWIDLVLASSHCWLLWPPW